MQLEIAFARERLSVDVPDDRLVSAVLGPGSNSPAVRGSVLESLERPLDYPPLRQAVVPGDRVVIPATPDIPDLAAVVGAACEVLAAAGVDPASVTLLLTGEPDADLRAALPPGVGLAVHDPEDRAGLAYLATTGQGRRVYLNRLLTDADFVLPIGRLGFDPVLGYRGPWSTIYPGLSDTTTRIAFGAMPSSGRADPQHERAALVESAEVGWLLGSQFQMGVEADSGGFAGLLAGRDAAVRRSGAASVEAAWSVETSAPADLVLAGIGVPWMPAGWEELAAGLANAARLVRPGGKVVVLSRASGPPGPALSHLAELDDRDLGPSALKRHEGDPDYAIARRLAAALVRADLYILSDLDPDLVERLGMVPLARPEEARRLVAAAASCTVLAPADLLHAEIGETPP